MTRSRLPGLVPSRSASHSWNDGWVHADRSPVGSAFRTSSAGTSAATTRWAVKSTMASAGPPGDGMTSTKPSGGGWSPCAAACSITARGCSVTLGRLGLQQLVGGGVRVELSCRDLRHQSIEPLAAAPLLGARPEPLVHDGPQLLAQARVAPALEPAVGLERRATVWTIGGRQSRSPASSSITSRSRAVSAAPSRSALLTTSTSAISSRPALLACTPSPHRGFTTTTVVSAAPATSTST